VTASGRTKAGGLRLGFLGRIELNKGVDLLLAASRALPASGWTLSIAGSGEPAFTKQLQQEYGSANISFVGRVEPRAFLSEIDVLVVPSTFPETFGMSAAEALAMGVPVVASTIGALPELVQDGRNGFVFDPDVPGALDQLLSRIVANPAMIAKMSEACRESVAGFAPPSVARQYAAVYDAVVGR
jgi:glycosyltransferase involved in cell wall biosynthesis